MNDDFFHDDLELYINNVLKPYWSNFKYSRAGGIYNPDIRKNHFNADVLISSDILNGTDIEYNPKGKLFLHYTSIKNLISILRSQSVRLYDFNNFNDPLEFVYANKYFLSKERIELELKEFKSQLFGLSLCEYNEDNITNNINLWRLYADNGNGVCIVFELANENINEIYDYTFGKIKYCQIGVNIEELEKIRERAEEYQKKYDFSCTNLEDLLTPICCFYKTNLFKIENEIRLFHFSKKRPYDKHYDDEVKSDLNNQNSKVYFKEVPILNTSNNRVPQLKIKEILFGYNLKPEHKTDLELVIEDLNLPEKIPVKWSPIKNHFI